MEIVFEAGVSAKTKQGNSLEDRLRLTADSETGIVEQVVRWAAQNAVRLETIAFAEVNTVVRRSNVVVSRGQFEPLALYLERIGCWRAGHVSANYVV